MNLRILKNDMKRRKSVNIILFVFITIATVFLASSINNMLVVTSAVDYYMNYANVPDVNILVSGDSEKAKINEWLREESENVKAFDYNYVAMLQEKDITIKKESQKSEIDFGGISAYLGAMDVDYCKAFDTEGNSLNLQSGEMAMTQSLMDKNNLESGDEIMLETGEFSRSFIIKEVMKDAAYGSDMVGLTRILVSKADYDKYVKEGEPDLLYLYYVDTKNTADFNTELNDKGYISVMNAIERSTYTLIYSFDMVMAGLLILIGICLILIAMLVLRFTLVFTIEEDYREIGIMKAVGLKNLDIKKLYLLKYLVIVTAGALIGLAASIPVSRFMIAGVSENMIMEDSRTNLGVNIICTVFIIILVLLFCYGCTRKLNKISAIAAIRGGQSGERYRNRRGLSLHKRKWMKVPVFLGLNDMLSHVKRYLVLMITFCLSFILITIPLNTINTMQSNEMVNQFSLDPDSAVYIQRINASGEGILKSSREVQEAASRVERELADVGYEDASLTVIPIFFFSYGTEDKENKSKIMTTQVLGDNDNYQTYKEGTAPVLSNEIAFSVDVMEAEGWEIGDTVEGSIGGEVRHFIITGEFSDYMQLGKSARMNSEIDLSGEIMFDYWNVLVDMETDKTQEELAAELTKKLPDYEWDTAQEIIDRNVGGVQESLKDMLIPMTAMLCALIMLITLLMERLFIVREKGEIAMMKSVGYKNRDICLWQILRMVWVAIISMIAAIPLSLISNHFALKPVFAIMGADVNIQVVPWQVYGVYPGILFVGIIIATFAATGKVKKINIRELNNLE